jgi:hypothetical protein
MYVLPPSTYFSKNLLYLVLPSPLFTCICFMVEIEMVCFHMFCRLVHPVQINICICYTFATNQRSVHVSVPFQVGQPIQELIEFGVVWGGAGMEAGTDPLNSDAPQLSHLSSREPPRCLFIYNISL